MFLNSDTIKDRDIIYKKDDDFFMDEGIKIEFENISSYFHKETAVITNSVYEGRRLELVLKFIDDEYKIEIDSNRDKKYKNIYDISYGIEQYREERLKEQYQKTKKIVFDTYHKTFDITMDDGSIIVNFKGEKLHYKPIHVDKITLVENVINFYEKDRKVSIYAQDISDKRLFLELCGDILPIKIDTTDQELKDKAWRYFVIFVAIFGINGWFEICCMDIDVIETTSKLSGILLGVWVAVYPAAKLVDHFNGRKLKKELKNLNS